MENLKIGDDLENPKQKIPRWQSLGNIIGPVSEVSLKSNSLSNRARNRHDSQPVFPVEMRPSTTRHNLKGFFQDPTKCSIRENGVVKGYAACTNQGLVRNYNEDRVIIVLNITQPPNTTGEEWPKCSFLEFTMATEVQAVQIF